MKLPPIYAIRNLRRRPWQTMLTVLSIAVVAFAAVLMMSLSRGLSSRLDVTGSDGNLLMISRKGQNAMFSEVTADEVVSVRNMPGLALDVFDAPLVSPELLHMAMGGLEGEKAGRRAPITLRGVDPVAFQVHDTVRVTLGRMPRPGAYEMLAGVMAHVKLGVPSDRLFPGARVSCEGRTWEVVGRFSDGHSLFESEIWVPQQPLMTELRRRSHSLVVARFQSPGVALEASRLFERTGVIERFFKGWTERGYYRQFTDALEWVFWLSVGMVALVSLVGVLIGINTMYTAILTRLREIATQRILGFSRVDITVSLLTESLSMALVGGVLGAGAGLAVNDLPMNLSQGAFTLTVDGWVLGVAVALSAVVGLLGGLLAVGRGMRMPIIEALSHR